jgi:pimeloyl-ACP methyl ester carboxylesterase
MNLLKPFQKGLLITASIILLCFFYACSDDEINNQDVSQELSEVNLLSTVNEKNFQPPNEVYNRVGKKYGIKTDEFIQSERSSEKIYSGINVNIYKISTQSPHPDGSGRSITISGVVLIPKYKDRIVWFKKEKIPYRIRFVTPFTYTSNSSAASVSYSNIFSIPDEIDQLVPLTMIAQAWTGKFAVFVPDYPGFGDSYGDCFPPFVNKNAHNRSNYDFLKAGIHQLENMGYELKDELLIQGYSQGAFSAIQFARYLETNNLKKVKGLSAGGTPALLDKFILKARSESFHPHPFFFPYAYYGMKENNLISIGENRIIQLNKFASGTYDNYDQIKALYDGSNSILKLQFALPNIPSKLLMSDFINANPNDTNSDYANFFNVLRENSITPWNNKCQFKMFHGKLDNAVYTNQAFEYYNLHRNNGGNVSFDYTLGEHISGYLPFLLKTNDWFWNLR